MGSTALSIAVLGSVEVAKAERMKEKVKNVKGLYLIFAYDAKNKGVQI